MNNNFQLTERRLKSFWNKVDKTKSCWIWTGSTNDDGYGRCDVNYGSRFAHRVSWIIKNREIPAGMCVLHHCDNPPCVRPEHLWIGTHQDNMRDRDLKGRNIVATGDNNGSKTHPEMLKRGEQQSQSKLTEEKVLKIRQLYPSLTQSKIADMFGVSQHLISLVVLRKKWKHVK